jgi:hypothetical protein
VLHSDGTNGVNGRCFLFREQDCTFQRFTATITRMTWFPAPAMFIRLSPSASLSDPLLLVLSLICFRFLPRLLGHEFHNGDSLVTAVLTLSKGKAPVSVGSPCLRSLDSDEVDAQASPSLGRRCLYTIDLGSSSTSTIPSACGCGCSPCQRTPNPK